MFIVVISIFLISLKVFWGVLLNSYGVYYLPLILLALAIMFKDKFTELEWDYIGFYVLVLSILIGFHNIKALPYKNVPVQTEKGKIYVKKKYETTTQLLDFIKTNSTRLNICKLSHSTIRC